MSVDKTKLKEAAWLVREESGLQGIHAEDAMYDFELLATPDAVLALLAEIDKIDADRKACWAEFKVQGRMMDELKAENEALREDAERWRFVRNPIGRGSPFALWSERTKVFLGHHADEAIDAAMNKEVQP